LTKLGESLTGIKHYVFTYSAQSDTGVTFNALPTDPIYTLALDTPPAWIVSPLASPYDLDNLQLASVTSPVHASFQLKQLLIEGHARETTNSPPRGLQLQLTRNGVEVSDTLVMANVGYLQFKVTPGVYDLSIRPGRGTEVFEIESTGTTGWDSKKVNETGTEVTLASFEGMTILPRFTRKEGMETADVLAEVAVSGNAHSAGAIWSRLVDCISLEAQADTQNERDGGTRSDCSGCHQEERRYQHLHSSIRTSL
jgi:UDP-glucose:glycoprotein glucosyltransferase